jgi:hypothetical protein
MSELFEELEKHWLDDLQKCASFRCNRFAYLADKSLAHEYTLVSGLGAAPGLIVPDGGIEALIFGHRLMRVEADLAVAAPHCFRLREGEQSPAQSSALPGRGDGNIVEEQMFRPGQEDNDAGYVGPFLDYPHAPLGHARSVVVEHRPRRFADTGDVMAICLLDDLPNQRDIGGRRGADSRFIHCRSPSAPSGGVAHAISAWREDDPAFFSISLSTSVRNLVANKPAPPGWSTS